MGRARRCRSTYLHILDGDAMNSRNIDFLALSVITFLPAVGALALMLFPRGHRHRDDHGHEHYSSDKTIKWAALIISLLVFVISLHLPANWDYSQPGFQPKFEINHAWIMSPRINFH